MGRGGRGAGGQKTGGHAPPIPSTLISEQISVSNIRDIALTAVQKYYGPEISRFSSCMLQFFGNIWRLLIFSNYIGEIDQVTLDFLKRSYT